MKLFILTHCAEEENYTPRVFRNFEDAQQVMKTKYEELTKNEDVIEDAEIFAHRAIIFYVDDTYDKFEIFEVEVEE